MNCQEVAEQAGTIAEGEVRGFTRWRIRLHLARCPDCTRFVRQIALTRRTLSRAAPDSLSRAREDELVAALRVIASSAGDERGGNPS